MKVGFMGTAMKQNSIHPRRKHPSSLRLKKVRQVKSSMKSMLIYFFDTDGIIRKDFVLLGQTIHVKFDCSIQRWFREGMRWRWPDKWRTHTHGCAIMTMCLCTPLWLCSVFDLQKHDGYTPPPLLTWYNPL